MRVRVLPRALTQPRPLSPPDDFTNPTLTDEEATEPRSLQMPVLVVDEGNDGASIKRGNYHHHHSTSGHVATTGSRTVITGRKTPRRSATAAAAALRASVKRNQGTKTTGRKAASSERAPGMHNQRG